MPDKIELRRGDGILICRTDRIGDLILTIPLIETMKLRYPDCEIDVMASDYAAPILENNPNISGIIPISNDRLRVEREYINGMIGDLKKNQYKAALVVYPDRVVSKLIYKAGIKNRIGTARRFHSILFNRRLFHSRKKSDRHESEYNLDFMEFFRDGDTVTLPTIYITDKERENARSLLNSVGIKEPFVVIHPGSKGSAPAWPADFFARLYKILVTNGINVILTGTGDEKSVISKMERQIEQNIVNIAGKTDLRTLAAVLSQSELAIGNSTGPLHMAAAAGTRVVGFYPNDRVMSPKRWGPLGEGHTIFTPEPGKGMESIPVDTVANTILSRMKKAGASL